MPDAIKTVLGIQLLISSVTVCLKHWKLTLNIKLIFGVDPNDLIVSLTIQCVIPVRSTYDPATRDSGFPHFSLFYYFQARQEDITQIVDIIYLRNHLLIQFSAAKQFQSSRWFQIFFSIPWRLIDLISAVQPAHNRSCSTRKSYFSRLKLTVLALNFKDWSVNPVTMNENMKHDFSLIGF